MQDTEPDTTNPAAERPSRSRLALASATMGAVSFVFSCCGAGLAGALAVILGTIALERIRASRGTLRGRALAWSGIGLGTCAVAISLAAQWLVGDMQRSINEQLDAGVRATFAAVDEPGERAALAKWRPAESGSIEAAAIGAFAREARERYGNFESCTPFSEDSQPSLSGLHRLVVAVAFQFERERLVGSIDCTIRSSVTGLAPVVELGAIRLSDASRGNLVFPPEGAAKNDPAAEKDAPGTAPPDAPGSEAEDAQVPRTEADAAAGQVPVSTEPSP